ncbi:hypothetical protein PUNSTDRAFT_107750 [Punctularia strigosozonata HHB-11173 SS5]|uniref:Uncharacterized protein n=1 Tax=Punctularia strigosozonata (strain HHB-11173) TaxID=741275 RepID=R7S4T3_PUNST|nr:uncharacterized protein PUNSTDRAFT_107750 [Punctularia strigosozonata HHB-11173 SS5]EIN04899.1 hypothetical protein PUNSTDRAFT_107750 [Punctularia strigosozonata HHB-11173 SS5]
MIELSHAPRPASQDGLYSERLEAFMKRSLAEIKAFSEREQRPYEEIRRQVATWHCSYLFDPPDPDATDFDDRHAQVTETLTSISRMLEALHEVASVHSFMLSVDPLCKHDEGFLGGTILGREFWRGLRGGGVSGARAFKAEAIKERSLATASIGGSMEAPYRPSSVPSSNLASGSSNAKKGPASALKSEVYAAVRNALREASGVRSAEMKWTNHDKLASYGIQIVGWPPNIPSQNPSTLSVAQNQRILDAVNQGVLRFESLAGPSNAEASDGRDQRPMDNQTIAAETGDVSAWLVSPDGDDNDAVTDDAPDASSRDLRGSALPQCGVGNGPSRKRPREHP